MLVASVELGVEAAPVEDFVTVESVIGCELIVEGVDAAITEVDGSAKTELEGEAVATTATDEVVGTAVVDEEAALEEAAVVEEATIAEDEPLLEEPSGPDTLVVRSPLSM